MILVPFESILEKNPYVIQLGDKKIPGTNRINQSCHCSITEVIFASEKFLEEYISLEISIAFKYGEVSILTVFSNGDIFFREKDMVNEVAFISTYLKNTMNIDGSGLQYNLFCEMQTFKKIMSRNRNVKEGMREPPAPIPEYVMQLKNGAPVLFRSSNT